MKKTVQKTKTSKTKASHTKTPIYFRYEFSDETGCPEGGDIFEFSSLTKLQQMMGEVLSVAQNDGVTVSFTIGQDGHFFNYLNNTGLSQKEVEKEMVDLSVIPFLADEKESKPKLAKKKARTSSKSI